MTSKGAPRAGRAQGKPRAQAQAGSKTPTRDVPERDDSGPTRPSAGPAADGGSAARDPEGLERYALRVHQYGRISGVSLAVHAVPDAFLLLHTGVGCKYKAAAQISTHDWARQPHRREGWTEVGEGALIRGAVSRIGPYVRSWYDRHHPSLIVVAAATHLEMTGEDIRAAVAEAESTVPCSVKLVSGLGYDGDLWDGYASVLQVLLEEVPWDRVSPEPGHVTLVGYPFDRYEADHTANLQQLASLLGDLGLRLDAVLPGGVPLRRLAERAARSEWLVALPLAHRLGAALERSGRKVVHTGLPVGIAGTSRWLEAVGGAVGVSRRRIRQVAERRADFARQSLAPLVERNVGGRSAVFADTPLAAGLVGCLEDLGLPVRLVGLRDRSYGGAEGLAAHLGRVGARLPTDAVLWPDPSFRQVVRDLPGLLRAEPIRAVLGSAAELGALRAADEAPELAASPVVSGEDPTWPARLARLTVGFPATGYHVLYPIPTMGYGGAVALGQRLLEALHGGEWG